MLTGSNNNVMAMVTSIAKPTWPYCNGTYAIRCKICKMGFGQKEASPTFLILFNCLWTTFSSTSSNPKSFFASLMRPCNLKDLTSKFSKDSSPNFSHFLYCFETLLTTTNSPCRASSFPTTL